MPEKEYNLANFKKDFPDEATCLDHIFRERFRETCRCGRGKLYRARSRKCYACSVCGRQVYPLAGTVYEKSTTPLTLWFYALFLMTESDGKVSARELERQLRVTYKTAWRIKKKLQKTAKKKEKEWWEW